MSLAWQYRSVFIAMLFLVGIVYHIFFGLKIGRNGSVSETNLGESKIRFREVSSEIGPKFWSSRFKQGVGNIVDAGVIFDQPATLSISDLNADGFMDLVLLNRTYPFIQIALFNKSAGQYERRSALDTRLFQFTRRFGQSTGILVTDLNRDGKKDLIVSFARSCPRILKSISDESGKLESEPFLSESCPPATTIAEGDVDFDGKSDLIFSQYWSPVRIRNQANHKLNLKWMGGKSTLHLRKEGDQFQTIAFPNATYLNSLGLTYLEGAPSLGIFRGNDYSVDELLVLRDGKFEDWAESYIPYLRHGYAGMNSEFFDINNDGRLDLYVSNIYAPPYQRRGNVLWVRGEDGRFTDKTDEYGVRRCGYAWAGKAASFDNSRSQQMLVVNGVWENGDVERTRGGDYWNIRTLRRLLPSFIQTDAYVESERLYFFGGNRWCLFDLSQKPAKNIAESAGMALDVATRTMGLIDVDNSGRISVVTADIDGRVRIHKNETPEVGNWLGLHLVPDEVAIGARVEITAKWSSTDSARYVREIFPTNGYGAQSDPRIHIGLGDQIPTSAIAKVQLSNGQQIEIDFKKFNTYEVVNLMKLGKDKADAK